MAEPAYKSRITVKSAEKTTSELFSEVVTSVRSWIDARRDSSIILEVEVGNAGKHRYCALQSGMDDGSRFSCLIGMNAHRIEIQIEISSGPEEPSDDESTHLGAPEPLLELIDRYACTVGNEPLRCQARNISKGESRSFVDDVLLGDRRLPAVLISRTIGKSIDIDADAQQQKLAGLAQIYTCDTSASNAILSRLTELRCRRLACFGGSVRLYNLDCDPTAASVDHPIWQRSKVSESIWKEIASSITNNLDFGVPEVYLQARKVVDDFDIDSLQEKITSNEDEITALYDEVERLEDERELSQIKALISPLISASGIPLEDQATETTLSTISAPKNDPATHGKPKEADSVRDAVEMAQSEFEGVRFFPSALRSAAKSQYRPAHEVYRVFQVLDDYATRRSDSNENFGMSDKELFRECGIDYVPDESASTRRKFAETRLFRDMEKGREDRYMGSHIRIGGKKLRIHLVWDEGERRWLIGHVGRHLETSRN